MAKSSPQVAIKTFIPRIDKSVPPEVQRHLQLLYEKINNMTLGIGQMVQNMPDLVTPAVPVKKGAGIATAPAAASATVAQEQATVGTVLRVVARQLRTMRHAYREVSSAYAIKPGEDFQINCTEGSFAVNLPAAGGTTGQVFSIKNSGIGTITLMPGSGEAIDGANSYVLYGSFNFMVMSTGKGWIVIARNTQ